MSSNAIREFDAKLLLPCWLPGAPVYAGTEPVTSTFLYSTPKVVQTPRDSDTNTVTPDTELPPFLTEKLVVKPDQLIKRRGKAGLLSLNKGWEESKAWIVERAGKPVQVESTTGTLNNFIVGPFLPHPSNTEYYICTNSRREGDKISFTHEGGVDIGDVDARAARPTKVFQMQEDDHEQEELLPLPPRITNNLSSPTHLTTEPQVGASKSVMGTIESTQMDSEWLVNTGKAKAVGGIKVKGPPQHSSRELRPRTQAQLSPPRFPFPLPLNLSIISFLICHMYVALGYWHNLA
ncbi:ATP citrate (pro-S)-lyase [Rhizoctonia solani]|uniref:ATP citrate (Pro-S)-lyase n=1 Tax=Rhizoctonia solani TaxID=456999 RepID=A0A8H8P0W8_9AGAM|nr:ATP citrate (pro-S)-lyase [Rhizoctonia solani]QRW23185.1 ATP citrate (pro-S)-lyase [Rhizoctonia solani]